MDEELTFAPLDAAEGEPDAGDQLLEYVLALPRRDLPLAKHRNYQQLLDSAPKLGRSETTALLRRGDPALATLIINKDDVSFLRAWIGSFLRPDKPGHVMDQYAPLTDEAVLYFAVKEGLSRSRKEE